MQEWKDSALKRYLDSLFLEEVGTLEFKEFPMNTYSPTKNLAKSQNYYIDTPYVGLTLEEIYNMCNETTKSRLMNAIYRLEEKLPFKIDFSRYTLRNLIEFGFLIK